MIISVDVDNTSQELLVPENLKLAASKQCFEMEGSRWSFSMVRSLKFHVLKGEPGFVVHQRLVQTYFFCKRSLQPPASILGLHL